MVKYMILMYEKLKLIKKEENRSEMIKNDVEFFFSFHRTFLLHILLH